MASEVHRILALILQGEMDYTCFPASETKTQSKPFAQTPSGGLTRPEPL